MHTDTARRAGRAAPAGPAGQDPAVSTRHVPWLSRVEARHDERAVGHLRYDVRGTWAVLVHTEVAEGPGGTDAVLVAAALDLLRARGHRILTVCPAARAVLDEHPDWCDGVDELPPDEVVTVPDVVVPVPAHARATQAARV